MYRLYSREGPKRLNKHALSFGESSQHCQNTVQFRVDFEQLGLGGARLLSMARSQR